MCIRCINRNRPSVHREQEEDIEIVWNEDESECFQANDYDQQEFSVPHYCVACSRDPSGDLCEWHEKAELEIQARQKVQEVPPRILDRKCSSTLAPSTLAASCSRNGDEEKAEIPINEISINDQQEYRERENTEIREGAAPILLVVETVPRSQVDLFRRPPISSRKSPDEQKKDLIKTGLSTAIAIGLHNFPEGLATFITALDDPGLGAVLAIAIGLHNIPEGLCVALPIYYATDNRWKAFMWGCFAGLTEPVAAILGWLVLANAMTDTVYAILFGFVGGIMIMISLKELIPTAHRFDPEDTVVTYSILTGMGVMAFSLVLFKLTGSE